VRKKVNILIVCGSGIATSTMVAMKVKDMLAENGITATTKQTNTLEYKRDVSDYDLIVATCKLKEPPIPTVIGIAYITGRNLEETNNEILKVISELPE